MGRKTHIPCGYDGTTAHPDPRRERYAIARSRGGIGQSQAYRQCIAFDGQNLKATSCKSAAFKIDREPATAARIAYLRAEYAARLEVPETLTGTDLRDLMHEVTECLELAHDTAEGSVASESDLSKIRQRLTVHIGRLSRATTPELEEAKKNAVPSTPLNLPHWCDCHE